MAGILNGFTFFGVLTLNLSATVLYKRATFVTQLPLGHRYSPSHCWLVEVSEGRWRVGFTKFALRMLGELVDVQFEQSPDSTVEPGDVVGSVEGFKALSELYCVGRGRFGGGNPLLRNDLERIVRSPYEEGWLYEFVGQPDERCLSVDGYRQLLDVTIDRILEKQKADESAE